MGLVRQNPIQRTVRTAHLSVLVTVHNFSTSIQHRTVRIISPLTSRQHHSLDVVYRNNLIFKVNSACPSLCKQAHYAMQKPRICGLISVRLLAIESRAALWACVAGKTALLTVILRLASISPNYNNVLWLQLWQSAVARRHFLPVVQWHISSYSATDLADVVTTTATTTMWLTRMLVWVIWMAVLAQLLAWLTQKSHGSQPQSSSL